MDNDRRKVANALFRAIAESHPQYAEILPGEVPEGLLFPVPKDAKNSPFRKGQTDPAFGVSNDGKPFVLLPPGLNLKDKEGKAKLGHELIHYMQFLEMQREARREALGNALAFPNQYGPPAPPEIDGRVYQKNFSRYRRSLEKDAQKFETNFLGLRRDSIVGY